MRFRQYSSNEATIKEWSRQLNIVTGKSFFVQSTVQNTLNHWKDELNISTGTNTFGLSNTPDATLINWQNKLNGIYNK